MRVYARRDPVELFWSHVEPDPISGCWFWTASLCGRKRYPHFQVAAEIGKRRPIMGHRFSYEHCVGPIPKGLHLDHLCRTPSCVNPCHLEPVTPAENQRRGVGPKLMSERRRAIMYDKHGHPLFGRNLRLAYRAHGDIWRKCAICVARWARELKERKRLHDAKG